MLVSIQHRRIRSAVSVQGILLLAALSILGGSTSPVGNFYPQPQQPNGATPTLAPRYAVIDLGTNYWPTSVAGNGMVFCVGNGTTTAYRWVQGNWQTLLAPGATNFIATQMNNNGTVVGTATFAVADLNYEADQRGLVWTQNPAQPEIDPSSVSIEFTDNGAYGGATSASYSIRSYSLCLDAASGVDYSTGGTYGYEITDGFIADGIETEPIGPGTTDYDSYGDFLYWEGQDCFFSIPSGAPNDLGTVNWSGSASYGGYPYPDEPIYGAQLSFTGTDEHPLLANSHWIICQEGTWSSATESETNSLKYFSFGTGTTPGALFSGGTAFPTQISSVLALTHATNAADDTVVGADATGTNSYVWSLSATNAPIPLTNFWPCGIDTRYYAPPATGTNTPPPPVPDFQIVGNNLNNAAELFERTRDTNNVPINPPAYIGTLLQPLISSTNWNMQGVSAISPSGAIGGYANYTPTNSADPTAPGQHGVLLLPAELAVDANRDGTIAMANSNPTGAPVDTTSQTSPFRFWVNDGQNTAEDKAALYGSAVQTRNYSAGQINYKGDLENFARLWIYTGGLQSGIQSGAIKIALKWQNVTSGSPAINVYQAVSSDGGDEYLNDDTTAGNQIAGSYGTAIAKVTGTSPVVLPASLFTNLSSTNPKTYCLFEGAGAGVGELVMVFEDANGNVIGQGGQVYMSLKTVTDMYEQAQVTPSGPTDIPVPFNFPANGNWSSSTSANDANGPPAPTVGWNNTTTSNFEHPADETKNCILFVHGWIVTPQRYVQQSSECYKRLWWGGYKGLFATLQWPSEESGSAVSPNYVVDGPDYFDTEYRGFKYAGSLKQYTTSLAGQGYTLAVMAHSMGNIVSSEALKEGANFQYLMMDAAVSARCYDTNSTFLSNTSVTYTTPDLSTSGGYGGYFSGLSGVNNAYNSLDDTLLHDWTSANAILKGKTTSTSLSYVFTGGTGVQLQYNLSQAHPQYYYRDVFANGVTNYHESMTMYARTETDAAGVGAIEGAVNTDLNMQAYFPGSSAHSPQFDYDLSDNSGGTLQFYKDVITQFNFQ